MRTDISYNAQILFNHMDGCISPQNQILANFDFIGSPKFTSSSSITSRYNLLGYIRDNHNIWLKTFHEMAQDLIILYEVSITQWNFLINEPLSSTITLEWENFTEIHEHHINNYHVFTNDELKKKISGVLMGSCK